MIFSVGRAQDGLEVFWIRCGALRCGALSKRTRFTARVVSVSVTAVCRWRLCESWVGWLLDWITIGCWIN